MIPPCTLDFSVYLRTEISLSSSTQSWEKPVNFALSHVDFVKCEHGAGRSKETLMVGRVGTVWFSNDISSFVMRPRR